MLTANVVPAWMTASYPANTGTALEGEQNLIKLGGNDVMPDPGFVDLANGDYRLRFGSQYIGFGAHSDWGGGGLGFGS